METKENTTVELSKDLILKAHILIADLENIAQKDRLPTLSEKEKTHLKTKFVHGKLTYSLQKLTLKMFTEAALKHFIKHRIDPRFYDDSEDMAKQVVRLRNQIFSFLQVHERQHIMPMNTVLAEIKQAQSTQKGTDNKVSSSQILAYLYAFSTLFFEALDMNQQEIEQIKKRFEAYYLEIFKQLEQA